MLSWELSGLWKLKHPKTSGLPFESLQVRNRVIYTKM